MQGYCFQNYSAYGNCTVGWVVPFYYADGTSVKLPSDTMHRRVGGLYGSGPFQSLHGKVTTVTVGESNEYLYGELPIVIGPAIANWYLFSGHQRISRTYTPTKYGVDCAEWLTTIVSVTPASGGGYMVVTQSRVHQITSRISWALFSATRSHEVFMSYFYSERWGRDNYQQGKLILRDFSMSKPTVDFGGFALEERWFDEIQVFSRPLDHEVLSWANAAYMAAIEDLPQAEANSLANVFEVVSTITDLIRGDIPDFLGRTSKQALADTWLSYRYVYNTTLSDARDYANLARRLGAIADLPAITANGYYQSGGYTTHCSITIPVNQVIPNDFSHWLQKYGFKLSLYNAWDMVPYSFIVDWFVNVGDFLNNLEIWSNGLVLRPSSVWTSVTRDDGKSYTRWSGAYTPGKPIAGVVKDTSWRTLFFRLTDVLSIFG